jgi:hypothetical protein
LQLKNKALGSIKPRPLGALDSGSRGTIMTTPYAGRTLLFVTSISLLMSATACKESIAVESLSVAIRNTDLYQHPTVGGDEEGTRISMQAKHYSVSEMRRDSETNWIATYVYQPTAGYTGTDDVELEILTGSDGASAPQITKKVRLHFLIHE